MLKRWDPRIREERRSSYLMLASVHALMGGFWLFNWDGRGIGWPALGFLAAASCSFAIVAHAVYALLVLRRRSTAARGGL